MSRRVRDVRALEILDSRGKPTLSVTVRLSDGSSGTAQVPSGASTGKHEAIELRDADPAWYAGAGVGKAVSNVEKILGPAVAEHTVESLPDLDRRLIETDGTPEKGKLGANAILGVSCALARAVSCSRREPLWKTLVGSYPGERTPSVPIPMVNILSGGLHASRNIEFQDFLAVGHGFERFRDALHAIVQVHRCAREVLEAKGFSVTGVADEGGWGPLLPRNETAVAIVSEAIERAKYKPREQVSIALDVASSHLFSNGAYHLRTEQRTMSSAEMVNLLAEWTGKYPVISIEDGLDQDDWAGWKQLTEELGEKVQLIGDDLFTTNFGRLQKGIRERAGNAILIKMNQIGTLTETFQVLDLARSHGLGAVVSARSGETEDTFLADLAVASGAGQIKVGSITRSERLAKYNRLLAIEAYEGVTFERNLFQ